MESMILFLLPKIIAAFFVWGAISMAKQDKRRQGKVKPWHWWYIGWAGYGLVAAFTWGWLGKVDVYLELLCALGYCASLLLSMYKENQARKARVAALDAILNAARAQAIADLDESLKAFSKQIGERGEIVRSLDLVEFWEEAARQSETQMSLHCMAAQMFDEEREGQ